MRYEKIWQKGMVLPLCVLAFSGVGVAIMPKLGLLLVVVVMLLLSGFTFSSFSTPKQVGLAAGVAGVWLGVLGRIPGGWIEVPVFYIGVIVLVLVLSLLRGSRWRITWWGTLDRMLGGITWLWVFLYSLWIYTVLSLGYVSPTDVFAVIALAWVVEVIIFLLQHFKIAFVFAGLNPGPGRTVGTIGNPLSLNQFLFLAGAGAVEWIHHSAGNWTWLEIALGLLIVVLILLNFKRTTAIASVFGLVGLVAYGVWIGRREWWVWFGLGVALSVVLFMYWKLDIHRRIFRAIRYHAIYRKLVQKYGPAIPLMIIGPSFTRPYIWLSAYRLWLRSPIWGYGFEQIRRYLMEVRHPYTYYAEHQKGYDRSHNWFLDLLVEGGVLWFVIILLWLVSGSLAFSSLPALILLGAYFIHLFFLFNEISAMTIWATVFPLSGLGLRWGSVVIPVWLLLVIVPLAILSVLRELSDIYAGYGRAMRQKNLTEARESYRAALRVFPFQDEYVTRLMETDVIILRTADGTGNVPTELARELVSDILEHQNHVSITNYPDIVLGYLGYAYGWLYRLGCEECKNKAIELFESALSINPYNEEVISLFANFLGNVGEWDRTVEVLVSYLKRKLGCEDLRDVCDKLYQIVEEYLELVGSSLEPRQFLARLPASRPGWIGENIVKMAIFAAIRSGQKSTAEALLKVYDCLFVNKDEYFYDEMFVALKALKS